MCQQQSHCVKGGQIAISEGSIFRLAQLFGTEGVLSECAAKINQWREMGFAYLLSHRSSARMAIILQNHKLHRLVFVIVVIVIRLRQVLMGL